MQGGRNRAGGARPDRGGASGRSRGSPPDPPRTAPANRPTARRTSDDHAERGRRRSWPRSTPITETCRSRNYRFNASGASAPPCDAPGSPWTRLGNPTHRMQVPPYGCRPAVKPDCAKSRDHPPAPGRPMSRWPSGGRARSFDAVVSQWSHRARSRHPPRSPPATSSPHPPSDGRPRARRVRRPSGSPPNPRIRVGRC